MYNIKIRDINPTARYNVTMTAYGDSADVETKTMDGETLIAMINGCAHLYDIDAEPIPAEPEASNTETTEPAEPTDETAQDAERGDRIADITGAIRREKLASIYRTKQRTTARNIREAMKAGAPTVCVGYCDAWAMLSGITPDYYTAGVYGWNCDIYIIAGLTICTGYRGMIGAPAVDTAEYERKARITDTAEEQIKLLAEWIAANLDAIQTAREGARA